jgi:hypothetical protein
MCNNEPITNRSTFTELCPGQGGSIMDETKILFPIGPGPTTQLRHRARIVIGGEDLEEICSIQNTSTEGCEHGIVTRNIPHVTNIFPIYEEKTNIVLNNTVILNYLVDSGKSFNISGFNVSGDLPAKYKLIIQDDLLNSQTYFTYRTNAGNLNGIFNLTTSIGSIPEGYRIKIIGNLISSYNGSPPAANYEATLLGFETTNI